MAITRPALVCAGAVAAALALAGCARWTLPWAAGGESAPVRPASSPSDSEAGELDALLAPTKGFAGPGDAIVRVVGPQVTCSGVLIDEDLVLTAHHCVARRNSRGDFTPVLVSRGSVQVQLGEDYLPWGNVGVKAIFAPSCGQSGGRGDVAVLVLERKIVGIATMPLRHEPPRTGEEIMSAGFGRCALSPEGIRRRERLAGPIGAVFAGTFEAQASVCPGDSGGPAFDRTTNEVVGVVSLSAMDHDETTSGRSVFARVDGTPKLVAYARLVADGADAADIPPLGCER